MTLRLLLGYAAGFRASLALACALMTAEGLVALGLPWLGGRFLAGTVFADTAMDANSILAWLLLLFAAQALLKFSNAYLIGHACEGILASLRSQVYDHLQALPVDFHHQRRHGEAHALITYDVGHLVGFITGPLVSAIPMLLTSAGAVVLMMRIDPLLAAGVAFFIPLFYLLLRIIGRRLRPLASQMQQANETAVAIADENLGLLPAIKSFTRETFESQRYRDQLQRVRQLGMTQRRIHAALEPSIQFAAATAVVLILWLARADVQAGGMPAAQLISFLLYAALLTRPVSAIAGMYGQTQMMKGSLHALQKVLTEPCEPMLHNQPAWAPTRGEIEFRAVDFSYPGRAPTIKHLNLHIRGGETVAITGKNGAGKSTLAHLLIRLHEPIAGHIRIDGVDVASINLRSLRDQIGIVPQHVLLFNGSVRDNIAYGRPHAQLHEIEHAARTAQAHSFIAGLPQGYETVIGHHGVRLSGGQRQRIALARALLKDPRILLLDEATAMFDPEGEKSFVQECRESLRNRTVILITHRPASLALADRVWHMVDGAIEETCRVGVTT